MKVLFLGRFDLFDKRGGDTVQIENTAEELKKLGVEVIIKTSPNCGMSDYDLIHIFQLDWIPEIYFYAKKAKESGKSIILSPIHHNINEVKKLDDIYVFDFTRISRVFFKDQFKRDTFKNVYRSFVDIRRMPATLFSIFYGFKKMQKEVLQWSKKILVQTELEARDLKETFDVNIDCVKIPNGVGRNYLTAGNYDYKQPLAEKDYVISVGRIEPRKNQLNIIKAVELLRSALEKEIGLVFIGCLGERKHLEYSTIFLREVGKRPWIKHISKVPYEEMPAYYKNAKVCVSASWFETTGLTSLEALFCGTNAVASGERAKEYLGNFASYCSPESPESIKDAIRKEYLAPRPQIDENMKYEYTWENAARKTLEVYKEITKE